MGSVSCAFSCSFFSRLIPVLGLAVVFVYNFPAHICPSTCHIHLPPSTYSSLAPGNRHLYTALPSTRPAPRCPILPNFYSVVSKSPSQTSPAGYTPSNAPPTGTRILLSRSSQQYQEFRNARYGTLSTLAQLAEPRSGCCHTAMQASSVSHCHGWHEEPPWYRLCVEPWVSRTIVSSQAGREVLKPVAYPWVTSNSYLWQEGRVLVP